MNKKRVTLFVNAEIYDKYREYCKKNGIVLSKKFELFMEKELNNRRRTSARK